MQNSEPSVIFRERKKTPAGAKRPHLLTTHKTYLDELLGVEGAVPVPTAAHWLGQDHPGSVDGLPAVGQVYPAGHLSDQHGGQALGSESVRV